jgi:hypothetical protein
MIWRVCGVSLARFELQRAAWCRFLCEGKHQFLSSALCKELVWSPQKQRLQASDIAPQNPTPHQPICSDPGSGSSSCSDARATDIWLSCARSLPGLFLSKSIKGEPLLQARRLRVSKQRVKRNEQMGLHWLPGH